MKKTLILFLLLLGVHFLQAQNEDRVFKPWKFEVSLGAAIPQGTGNKAGVLLVVEPKYAVVDQFWIGLRLQTAIMARAFQDGYGSTNVSGNASYMLTGDCYFTTGQLRPFIGAGAGLCRLASATVDNYGYTSPIASEIKFGGMVRVGFELGHFRMGLEYNLTGNSIYQYTDNSGNPVTSISKNSYIGIKIGAVIGGGRLE